MKYGSSFNYNSTNFVDTRTIENINYQNSMQNDYDI